MMENTSFGYMKKMRLPTWNSEEPQIIKQKGELNLFEQDYVMRLIKEMVKAILKLLFNIDTDSPSAELLEDAEEQQMLDELLDMVDNGLINEAENKIYEITEEGKKTDLEIALLFYSYLNDKSDEFLETHNYSRDEIKAGLKDVTVRYGVDGFAEMFLQ